MGKLACKCGKILSTVDCPNEVELTAFEGTTIKKLLSECPEMPFTEVVLDFDIPCKSYWYCRDCGRVYVFRDDHQVYHRLYLVHAYHQDESLEVILTMRELHFYTDKQIEERIEENPGCTLAKFLAHPPHPYRYFMTADRSKVYAYNTLTKEIVHYYKLEGTYHDEPETMSYSS